MNLTSFNLHAAFDTKGLDGLKRQSAARPAEAMQAAAKQIEGLFLQMMLKSMRQAGLSDGLMNSASTAMFRDMYDQQIAQDLVNKGSLGFAPMLLKQLGETVPASHTSRTRPVELAGQLTHSLPRTLAAPAEKSRSEAHTAAAQGQGQGAFISRLLRPAMAVAQRTGIPHQLIIAQAALESGWGRSEILTAQGKTSHNLFGIKATPSWKGKTTEITTTEYVDGVAKKVKAAFRVYGSYTEALADYATMIVKNPRYQQVAQADSAEHGAYALQRGGYATDPHYAGKLINIIDQVKNSVSHSINAYKNDLSALF